MRKIKTLFLACAICALRGATTAATPPPEEIVTMSPMQVNAGVDEFVPSWVFDTKPAKLVLRSAARVPPQPSALKWVIRPDLGIKDGDEIVAVNGKALADAGFIDAWKAIQKDGTALQLEIRSPGALRSRKIEYILATRPAAAAAAPRKK